jgi:hypothetical protein
MQLHDVAVINVTTSSSNVVSGQAVTVTVIVENQGTVAETFPVTIFYNVTFIETRLVWNLAPGEQEILGFSWNTGGLTEASYGIRAEADFVPGETKTDNNAYKATIVEVSAYSLQPLDWVTTLLFILLVPFGLLFFFVLRRRRKKKAKAHIERKTDAFSKQFGITHQQMKGKKMLFEMDPKSDYNKDLLSFGSEARNNDEILYILTNKNSPLHLRGLIAFSGDHNVKFLLLTSETSSPRQINETLLPANNLSVLFDSFSGIQKAKTKKNINVLFDNLSDLIFTCGFERTQEFMHRFLKTISSHKVTALFAFNSTAHSNKISSSIRDMFQREV